MRHRLLFGLLLCYVVTSATAPAQFLQQGRKLAGAGFSQINAQNAINQGSSVAISADGNTMILGGVGDNGFAGAAWIFTRNNGLWSQQGLKLIGSDATPSSPVYQGWAVALSADGNTALVGGPYDNSHVGAAWAFTRSNGVWSQQGPKLVGSFWPSTPQQGTAVALSADGNTALIGEANDGNTGAVWVFTRSNGVWSPQGDKLVGTGAVNPMPSAALQGAAVALSADGNTAIVGSPGDNAGQGAVWIFIRSNGVWSQQGAKLVGAGSIKAASGQVFEGVAVALSADGNTALAGGRCDNGYAGAAWVFVRNNGVWSQQGAKLVPTGATGMAGVGTAVALSGDGNIALLGGPVDKDGATIAGGSAWIFERSNGVWTQQGAKLFGNDAVGAWIEQGSSVALSARGDTAIIGGPGDNSGLGAAWVFIRSGPPHFAFSGTPVSATLGTPMPFTVTAGDDNGNVVSSYAGTVHFTATDATALLPADITLTNGTGSFLVTFKTAGSQTLTATDKANAAITGDSGPIVVGYPAATHFTLAAPAVAVTGTPVAFTVTARDASNNPATGYAGTVRFKSSDLAATLPTATALTNGTGQFTATLKTVGSQTITATDTVTASITGTSNPIAVGAGAVTHLVVSAPASAVAGTAFNITVTAKDAANNSVADYSGMVCFTSSDQSAILPANVSLANGTGTFPAALKTAGSQTITATDTATPAFTGSSGVIAVAAAATTHFSVSAPASAAAGTAFNITVTAGDAYNNSSVYAGTIHFASSDIAASLPPDTALANGTGMFPVTLKKAGSQTITATNNAAPSVTGTSAAIVVSGGAATHLSVSAPSTASAGTPVAATVTALDRWNNTSAAYTGTIHFASTDRAAVVPADGTLTNGTRTWPVTLKTAGSQTFTATDTATPSIAGVSGPIAVTVAGPARVVVSAPASATAGAAVSFTVAVQDSNGNPLTGYSGSMHFTATDTSALLPGNSTLANGTGTFQMTFKTAANQTITATDTAASLAGTSGAIAVSAGTATHFAVSAPTWVAPGKPFQITVTAFDAYGNTSPGYPGTVHYTASDAAALLPDDSRLANGTGTFPATLETPGVQTITAADTATPSISGNSGAIAVGGGAAPVSVSPGAGTGAAVTMTFIFSDPRGWQDLNVVNVLINSTLEGRHACYLAYSQPDSVLYLMNDAGAALLPALTLDATGNAGNAQCQVNARGSAAAGNGTTLTLTLNLTFSAGFAGNQVTYLSARDLHGGNSGWQALGTWNVPGGSWGGPEVVGAAPARSSGLDAQTFLFTFADTGGWQDLGIVNVLINFDLNGAHACYLAYSRPGNILYLVDDPGTGLLRGLVVNGSGILNNSQCTISGASAAGSGDTLKLTLNIAFKLPFTGNQLIYLAARSNGDLLNSGWQAVGSRTVQSGTH